MKKVIMILVMALGFGAAAFAEDTKASFPGGEKACQAFITETMVYPPVAQENGIEGVVTLVFVVRKDGSISDIKVKRMVDVDLESEAERIVKKMPAWTPATKDGVAVDSTTELPIAFILQQEE